MKTIDDILSMCTACVDSSKECTGCKESKRCNFYFGVIWASVLEYFFPLDESYIR